MAKLLVENHDGCHTPYLVFLALHVSIFSIGKLMNILKEVLLISQCFVSSIKARSIATIAGWKWFYFLWKMSFESNPPP